MEKIKVSNSVAGALDVALKVMGKEKFFEEHSNKLRWNLDIYLPLNEISNWDMAQILINGYEVEETPEEQLLSVYKKTWHDYNTKTGFQTATKLGLYENGFAKGIEKALDTLGIKITGIND